MNYPSSEAATQAFAFLMDDLAIAPEDHEWFTVLGTHLVGDAWYVVEIGLEGLPDKWVLQFYDTGECDPNYTFVSPLKGLDSSDLEDLPEAIAAVLTTERNVATPTGTGET